MSPAPYSPYQLKHKYKMNPLAINVTPPLPLKLGEENLKNFAASGFNLIQIYPNQEVMRFLNKRGFIDKGSPYFGWMVAIQSAVIKTALKFNISLIFLTHLFLVQDFLVNLHLYM